MAVCLPALMAYSLIGEEFHEITGTVMFALFIVHNVLNRRFWKSAVRGKYSRKRVLITVIDAAIFLIMILQMLSGILISRHLYTFLPDTGFSASSRRLHMTLAYWGLILMSMHAGMHIITPLQKLRRKHPAAYRAFCGILLMIAVYGILAFFKRQIPQYMFARIPFAFFDFDEPKIFFLADYLSIMIFWGTVGTLLYRTGRQK